jgi:small ligand-binding sensory domain FIST
MRCASAFSTAAASDEAFGAVLDGVARRSGGTPANLAVCFVTPHHATRLPRLAGAVISRGLARHVIGCSGESIVADDREIEDDPGVVLWTATMPGARLTPVRLSADDGGLDRLDEALGASRRGESVLLTLGDPFTFPADPFLAGLNRAAAGLRVVGGMASAGQGPGENRLVLDGETHDDGAVALLIEGSASIRTVVSQGCRPIGRPMIVTRASRNLIQELGRRPAVEVFREIFAGLDPADQALVRGGLHVGRVINEYQERFGRGDFLVRNVMGVDETGAIAITDLPRVGQTVQFHVRDADTADEDLLSLLEGSGGGKVAGALLFTCNGRGSRLFPAPDHDAAAIRRQAGPVPVAGFFAMGELGPVGGQNFVHGFTASIALFEEGTP